jgi:hypothetical protein
LGCGIAERHVFLWAKKFSCSADFVIINSLIFAWLLSK